VTTGACTGTASACADRSKQLSRAMPSPLGTASGARLLPPLVFQT
jgi:hypothetical protein